jgi:16S rRNA G966 N2-methylase RsmD
MIENKLHLLPTTTITVEPDRQRRSVPDSHIENLAESISSHGLLHPIIVTRENTLVVGECRLKAWKYLEKLFAGDYLAGIPARYLDEVEPIELKAIELAENIQRENLDWQDKALAFLEYFEVRSAQEAQETYEDGEPVEFSYASMGGELHCNRSTCSRQVKVGRAVKNGDKDVLACQSARAAGAMLDRRTKRVVENEMVTFTHTEASPEASVTLEELDLDLDLGPGKIEFIPNPPAANYLVEQADFRQWIDIYDGPKFNFVHCDFPYGIGLHESDLYRTAAKDLSYEDSEEIYEELCQSLVYATGDILSKSCHILFWFPMAKYFATLQHFSTQGFRVEPYPLIWGKADKMGILPDPTRGPRRIYESAFIMSLGDRKVVRSTVNAAWFPSGGTDKEHASLKPQEMLEDFFRMFIDEDSVVLDPSCGSGTALAAAMKLGAQSVHGLDINPECVQLAEDNCRNQFILNNKED